MNRKGARGHEESFMIGIDVSKESLAATLVDPQTQRRGWQVTVPHTPRGIAALLRRTPPGTPWVVEPTGAYSRDVVQRAAAAQQVVLLAPPRRAKAFLAAAHRAKTDRVDSEGLARFGLALPLHPYPVKTRAVEQTEALLRARAGLTKALVQLQQQVKALPDGAAYLLPAVQALRQQGAALDAALARHTAADPVVTTLRAVPGIGPVTAAAVAACFASHTFPSAAAFVGYIGLDPRVRESGQWRGRRRLSKQGDAQLRRLFYLCAQSNSHMTSSPFRQQYERELAKGLPRTAALAIVARKLARLSWSLIQHGTHYDVTRIYTQT